MNYLLTPLYPHFYCLLLPPQISTQHPTNNTLELSECLSQKNTEII